MYHNRYILKDKVLTMREDWKYEIRFFRLDNFSCAVDTDYYGSCLFTSGIPACVGCNCLFVSRIVYIFSWSIRQVARVKNRDDILSMLI